MIPVILAFVLGFVRAVCLAHEEHNRQADKIKGLLRELYDTRDELSAAKRLLTDRSNPDWWCH